MLLQFEKLTIRNATADDAEQLASWWNDGAVMAHAGFPNGLDTTAADIRESLTNDSDAAGRRLMIEASQIPIGEMNYRNIGGNTAEIGIKICDSSQQDKGLGKKLLSMLISSLFHELGYEKIILDTNLDNQRAQHVYERLGFRKVRVRENAWQDQLGAWRSAVDYELLPTDFVNFVSFTK